MFTLLCLLIALFCTALMLKRGMTSRVMARSIFALLVMGVCLSFTSTAEARFFPRRNNVNVQVNVAAVPAFAAVAAVPAVPVAVAPAFFTLQTPVISTANFAVAAPVPACAAPAVAASVPAFFPAAAAFVPAASVNVRIGGVCRSCR